MVDSGMRSPEETWSGMSAKVRTWTWTWTWRSSTSSPPRWCTTGRPLNAAAGAVMRMRNMDAVRREHFGSAYVEEPRRSHRDSMEEMDVAAVGVRGRGRWEPRSTSRPAFMVF